jgi:hypothetical protein
LSLVSIGLHPLLEIIESGSGDGWANAERRWIAFYRASGARLVNGTDGVEGAPGRGTPEQRSSCSFESKREPVTRTAERRRKKSQRHLYARKA